MLGHKERDQGELFITGTLRQLIPDDHVLVRVDRILDLSWLKDEIWACYCPDNGRPGISPEVAVRLMLAGMLLGIVHDRRLLREASVNIAIRWFVGYGLHERLPYHSSLTRIRQRWGEARFREVFQQTVEACLLAKIAKAEIIHVDASLIRADVSWDSLVERHVTDVISENDSSEIDPAKRPHAKGKTKKISRTDPDARLATTSRNKRLEPSYKQHAVVDDMAGVILDLEVTTGDVNEGDRILDQVASVREISGIKADVVTADAGYAYAKVFSAFEQLDIGTVIPVKSEPIRCPLPLRRFRYDAKNDILKCLRGRILRPKRKRKYGRFFYSRAKDCNRCDLRDLCVSAGRANRAVVIGDEYPALVRARRRRLRWGNKAYQLYQRHRWHSEGFHGEAKSWHGLARAARRGLDNMKIQAYLTAAAINLKRLAKACMALLRISWAALAQNLRAEGTRSANFAQIVP